MKGHFSENINNKFVINRKINKLYVRIYIYYINYNDNNI